LPLPVGTSLQFSMNVNHVASRIEID
jgi:hypothetical protein